MTIRFFCLTFLVLTMVAVPAAAQQRGEGHPVAVTYYRVFDGHRAEYAAILEEQGRPVYDQLVKMGVFRRSTMYWNDAPNAEWQLVSLVEWESEAVMEAGSGDAISEAVRAVFPGMTTEEWFAVFAPHREVVRREVWVTGP